MAEPYRSRKPLRYMFFNLPVLLTPYSAICICFSSPNSHGIEAFQRISSLRFSFTKKSRFSRKLCNPSTVSKVGVTISISASAKSVVIKGFVNADPRDLGCMVLEITPLRFERKASRSIPLEIEIFLKNFLLLRATSAFSKLALVIYPNPTC